MDPDAEDMSSAAGSSTTTSGSSGTTTATATSASTTPSPSASPSPGRAAGIKCCSGCQTTKTPLWRGGPDGPKSLCNACGIRYRKRRREVLGITDDHTAPPHNTAAEPHALVPIKKRKQPSSPANAPKVNVLRLFPKQGERLLDQRLLLWLKTRQRHSRLREEEQAAVLLMALSCGMLYA